MLIDEEPADIIMWLLINQWDSTNIDVAFDETARISTGWWDDSSPAPQITLSGTNENTSPTGIDPSTGNLTSWVDGILYADVWVAADRDATSGLNPKKLRWQLRWEVHRIIGANQDGTMTDAGEPQLTRLETGRVREHIENDDSPTVLRYRIAIGYQYHARPE